MHKIFGFIAFASVGVAMSVGCGSGPGAENAEGRSATETLTATKLLRQGERTSALAVDVQFGAEVTPEEAKALLDSIVVSAGDDDTASELEANRFFGFASVSADPSRELNPGVPALAVRVRSLDPELSTRDLEWSWPIEHFPASREPGVVLSSMSGITSESADAVGPIFIDGTAGAALRPEASVQTKWQWFGMKFYVRLSKQEACSLVAHSSDAKAMIEEWVPSPYGTLVGLGIAAQVHLIKSKVGTDGVRLRVFGPASPTPGIIYKVDRRGADSSC